MKLELFKTFLLFYFFPVIFSTQRTEANSYDSSRAENEQINKNGQNQKLTLDISNWNSFQKLIDKGLMNGYFTVEQIDEIMESINEQFPELVLPVKILGQSFENRNIKLHCFTKKSGNTTFEEESKIKAIAMVTALHHPREPMSLSMQMFLLHKILVDYHKNDEEYVNLLEKNILCFLPIVNIDGYSLIVKNFKEHNKFIPIRKNRNNSGSQRCSNNEIGVDLNRNYDYGWDMNQQGSSTKPCDEDYRGKAPFSEPETKAIKNFVEKYQSQLKVVINLHAYGNLWVFPFNCYLDDSSYRSPRITSIYNDFIENANVPENARIGNAIKTVGYTANGEASDWLLGKFGIISMSPEIGLHHLPDDKFFPSKEFIYPVVLGDFDAVYYMLSKLNPKIRLNNMTEFIQNDRKSISFNLFNEAYRDISQVEIQISIAISGITQGFLENPSLPDLYLVEKDLDNSTSDSIAISISSLKSEISNEIKSVIYDATQDLTFKSWSLIQITTILPYSQYDGVQIEIKTLEDGKEIFRLNEKFGGKVISMINRKVSILLFSITLAILATFLIICFTQYYLRNRQATKNNNNNIYGSTKPTNLEFAQIENDGESLDSSRV